MLMLRIDRYLRVTRMTPSRFGRLAVGDPNLLKELRDGRAPRTAMMERLTAYLDTAEQAVADRGERPC